MQDYEIVFIIHPDCDGKVSNVINRYIKTIDAASGKIYRMEDWGCRQLAYPIKKINKAYYVLLNIQIPVYLIKELDKSFHLNEKIIRSLIIRSKYSTIGPSPMMKQKEILNEENTSFESQKKLIM